MRKKSTAQPGEYTKLSERLKAAQDRRKTSNGKAYTIYRLCRDAGVDYGYTHRVMNGKSLPTREFLAKLCKALECSGEDRAGIFHAAGYVAPEEEEEMCVA